MLRKVQICCELMNVSEKYLEVSQQDETGGTDPGGGEAGRVQDAVPMLLDHLSVAQQADQHH